MPQFKQRPGADPAHSLQEDKQGRHVPSLEDEYPLWQIVHEVLLEQVSQNAGHDTVH